MASNTTGSGMSAAIKLQAKSVRVAVEQRMRKTENGVDREHWVAAFAIWSERDRITGYAHEQPSIQPRRRHEMSTRKYVCGPRDLLARRNPPMRGPVEGKAA